MLVYIAQLLFEWMGSFHSQPSKGITCYGYGLMIGFDNQKVVRFQNRHSKLKAKNAVRF